MKNNIGKEMLWIKWVIILIVRISINIINEIAHRKPDCGNEKI